MTGSGSDMDEFFSAANIDKISSVGILATVAILTITDKIWWHTRGKRAEEQRDRWEKIALDALSAGAQAGVAAAETTAEIVSSIKPPDPGKG